MQKIHFIGIGGIGMSALARYYKSKGYFVSGSDTNNSDLLEDLKKEGINIFIGHSEKNISGEEKTIFYTEAIPEKNIELQKSRELGLNLMTYFQGIGELSKKYKTIAVAGAHGKSTTTAMIGILMQKLGLSPNVIVGTKVPNFGNKNILIENGEYLIVEACEYRESFLNLHLYGAVILNIEAEHLDYYKNEENYLKAFGKFVGNIPKEGFLIINGEDRNCEKIIKNGDIKTENISKIYFNEVKNISELKVPGDHIKFDAISAIKCVNKIQNTKTYSNEIKILQEDFNGTWRRFEVIGKYNGNVIISDYGHHPTEIKATLKGAKEKFQNKKITCIFEPHQYSRTIELFEDFCESFTDCDTVIIPGIYEVRDKKEDLEKMSAGKLVNGINKISKNAIFIDGYEKTENFLKEDSGKNDEIFIFMGAGNIDNLARRFN